MKKSFLITSIIFILVLFVYVFVNKINDDSDNELTRIKVAEVTHSIFYAPWYVSLENGYFEDEGLDIEVILTPGADKVAAAVLSNDVQIGFCGPESTIYVYEGGEKDYLQSFAGLTKRDGQFIVSREKIDNFSLDSIKGKEILVGRQGGMPALNFLNALYNGNYNEKDFNINYSIDFASLTGAFIGGTGDFVNLFEPNAIKLEKEGLGYIVGSVGMLSGEMPYTAFNARKSYIENNKETIEKFSKALNRGLEFVKNNSDSEVARVIANQFTDLSIEDITKIVERYRKADSWYDSTFISSDSFNNLQDIMIRSNLIEKKVSYDDLINNLYSE